MQAGDVHMAGTGWENLGRHGLGSRSLAKHSELGPTFNSC
jgi:hypothetical protein